jgi:hypothetical protein
MNHLLTPAREHQQQENGDGMARKQNNDPFAAPHQTPAQSHDNQMGIKQESSSNSLLQQPVQPANAAPHPANSLKRGADEELTSKRAKRRKHRPIWATLARSNPNFDGTNGYNGQPPHKRQQQQHQQHQQQRPQQQPPHQQQHQQPRAPPQPMPPQPRQQTNGSAPQSNGAPPNMSQPWLQQYPLDMDLAHARSILGPWEKTFKWNTPLPAYLRVVQDWLWQQLEQHSDIGNDPRTGIIEIEAKIGTLIKSGEHERAQGEFLNAGVIHPALNKLYRFESRMEEVHLLPINSIRNKNKD